MSLWLQRSSECMEQLSRQPMQLVLAKYRPGFGTLSLFVLSWADISNPQDQLHKDESPLVKFPGFVMEAGHPWCGDGGEVKLVHIPAGEDGKRRFGHDGQVSARGPGGLPVDGEWTPEKGPAVYTEVTPKKGRRC